MASEARGRAVVRPVRQQAGLPNWWKVCFVHGDQTKYYRKLYGRKSSVRSLRPGELPGLTHLEDHHEAE
jgi:hypothetical protein